MPDDPRRPERPDYTVYRTRPRLFRRGAEPSTQDELRRLRKRPGGDRRRPWTARRIVKYVVLGLAGWLLLSLVLFFLSAQLQRGEISDGARGVLAAGGYPLTSANNILVLGSDLRTRSTAEPGSTTSGPSRSDTIMLVRTGGGANSRLSILRDTIVDIPGHGRQKINAAYAIGGPALAIQTVRDFLGVEIHHVLDVNFENFPELIDALGGIDVKTGCVVSFINGGFRNGGYTLRLKRGTNHLDGTQALALARTRVNRCRPGEDDRNRAKRQQRIMAGIKDRLFSVGAFVRLPWISWNAPKAIRSDMSGPTLLGLFASLATSGSPPIRVLKPNGFAQLSDGSSGVVVSDIERRREVRRFLRG